MSMMFCKGCDALVDTDHDVEGLFEDDAPFRWWCSQCVADANDTAMLTALEKQNPELYRELTDQ